MRAAVLYEHGSRDVLQIAGCPYQNLTRAGSVQMKAAALNRLDLWVREGWKGMNLPMPHITCADGAGIVNAVGERVTNVQSGSCGRRPILLTLIVCC
jgi:NADPH:quinone reductase-like Zn-dependent oxidoreductase